MSTSRPATTSCPEEDLPVNPFVSLRVAYGMLLGEDDFRTLIGNPRGKQMMHSAWLHGPGVVWGYPVLKEGTWTLKVGRGLALDGLGRELLLDAVWGVDVREWLKKQNLAGLKDEYEGDTYDVEAHVVVEFRGCPSSPVPTLADPCDVTRRHDDFSRLVESARVVLRLGARPPDPWPPAYHRVRVLLGLDRVGPDDEAGEQAAEAARRVADAPPEERAEVLLREFRAMAAHDGMDRQPAQEEGDVAPTLFPATEDDAVVVLAAVTVTVRDADNYSEVVKVEPDPCVRQTLLPTAVIQELTGGPVPGDEVPGGDAGGPRVVPDSLRWSPANRCLTVEVTGAVNEGSAQDAVSVTSLSADGWTTEEVNRVTYEPGSPSLLVIHLDDRPAYELVRVVIRGTGDRPVYGTGPVVPLAGLVGGPPGGPHDGHDAVLTASDLMLSDPTAERAER
jgi:hypothetical protein